MTIENEIFALGEEHFVSDQCVNALRSAKASFVPEGTNSGFMFAPAIIIYTKNMRKDDAESLIGKIGAEWHEDGDLRVFYRGEKYPKKRDAIAIAEGRRYEFEKMLSSSDNSPSEGYQKKITPRAAPDSQFSL